MSQAYNEYLAEHKKNVYQGFCWLKENLYDIFTDDNIISQIDYQIQFGHDSSKNMPEEYAAYDAYFYGNNRSYEVVNEFNLAWLHHIHVNPHHWQHWVLNNDDPEKGEIKLKMPDNFVIEMICDWWSFSWKKGNLYEIFDWYEQRKNYIKLNEETKQKVETILKYMQQKLQELDSNNQEEIPDPQTGLDAMKEITQKAIPEMLLGGLTDALKNQANDNKKEE